MTRITPHLLVATSLFLAGCGAGGQKQERDFFTSGNREADQRADQRMAKAQQLQGDDAAKAKSGQLPLNQSAALYYRLGGADGIAKIVDDFVNRALADPAVNFDRSNVKYGGFNWSRNKSMKWDASKYNVGQLKKHFVQFLSLKTGGPTFYDGRDLKQAHSHMHISNPEFDAAVGDLKASLDTLRVPDKEQKELLAVIESTRPLIAEER